MGKGGGKKGGGKSSGGKKGGGKSKGGKSKGGKSAGKKKEDRGGKGGKGSKGGGAKGGGKGKSKGGKSKGGSTDAGAGKDEEPRRPKGKGRGKPDNLTRKERKKGVQAGEGRKDTKDKPVVPKGKKRKKAEKKEEAPYIKRQKSVKEEKAAAESQEFSRSQRKRAHQKGALKLKRKLAKAATKTRLVREDLKTDESKALTDGLNRKERKKLKKQLTRDAKASVLGNARNAGNLGVDQDIPKCRKNHAMQKVTKNPAGYQNQACCDICALENMPKKRDYFWHCGLCRWDICGNCARERLAKDRKGKTGKNDATVTGDAPGKKSEATDDVEEEDEVPRRKREIWLPTDSEAQNRAPVQASVVTDWAEGVPV